MLKISNLNILNHVDTSLNQAWPALLALVILALGNGLLNTLTTIRLEALGIDHMIIGSFLKNTVLTIVALYNAVSLLKTHDPC